MLKKITSNIALILITVIFFHSCGNQPENDSMIDPIAAINANSGLMKDIIYHTVDSIELKMDVYIPRIYLGEEPWWKYDGKKRPVLLYIHGGGWVDGEKETRFLGILPFVAKQWTVVNINYRLAKDAKAPAAIEDCRKALEWIYKNADKHQLDTNNIVVAGESAGGHLALMTGLLEKGDSVCGNKYIVGNDHKVKAIINWYGVADMVKLNMKDYVWIDQTDDWDIAGPSLSPINYVEKHSPAIISIHGTIDPLVPHNQAVILHKKCNEVGIKNKLHSIEGKKHGDFSAEEQTLMYEEIWKFLIEAGVKIQ